MTLKILVTGTPGTGKTTFCQALSRELGIPHHELSRIIIEQDLGVKKEDVVVFDPKKVKREIRKLTGILDSHCTEIISEPDIVVLMRCSIEELTRIYKERKYSDEKIRQNLEYEIFNTGEDEFDVDIVLYREKQTLEEMLDLTQKFVKNRM